VPHRIERAISPAMARTKLTPGGERAIASECANRPSMARAVAALTLHSQSHENGGGWRAARSPASGPCRGKAPPPVVAGSLASPCPTAVALVVALRRLCVFYFAVAGSGSSLLQTFARLRAVFALSALSSPFVRSLSAPAPAVPRLRR